jgi:hypothetical protein
MDSDTAKYPDTGSLTLTYSDILMQMDHYASHPDGSWKRGEIREGKFKPSTLEQYKKTLYDILLLTKLIKPGDYLNPNRVNGKVNIVPVFKDYKNMGKIVDTLKMDTSKAMMNVLFVLSFASTDYKRLLTPAVIDKYKTHKAAYVVVRKIHDTNKVSFDTTYEVWDKFERCNKWSAKNKDQARPDVDIIISLYVDNPPVRDNYGRVMLEYGTGKDVFSHFNIRKTGPKNQTDNFYNVTTGVMTLNDYKTATGTSYVFTLAPRTVKLIQKRQKPADRLHYLLGQVKNPSLALGTTTQLLALAFNRVGGHLNIEWEKDVGVNVLRHSYVTHKYLDPRFTGEQKAELARVMHSSMQVHMMVYNRVAAKNGVTGQTIWCPNCGDVHRWHGMNPDTVIASVPLRVEGAETRNKRPRDE